jgi:zinc/manganese transport system ATP-binding protein
MPKSSQAIIKATSLSAGYSQKIIWENASFEVNPGEFVGLLGPNGAGKTTLFRLLLGLMRPISGELTIFNELPKRGNSRIGYIPQRRLIDEGFNIEALELVRLGVNGSKWGFSSPISAMKERELALQALKSVDAEGLSRRPLGQLSGGELQRIFLAQALVGKPELLLLDEPLANLDIRRESELVKLISSIAKKNNVAIMLIAHDINPLLPVVDRLIYAVNGQIATGRPSEIITTKALTKLYGAPVEVLKDSRGRVAVLGTEEAVHHD